MLSLHEEKPIPDYRRKRRKNNPHQSLSRSLRYSCTGGERSGNGMLGTDGGCLAKDAVPDLRFDLLDLLDGLLFVEAIYE
jgi:hypothetical protein